MSIKRLLILSLLLSLATGGVFNPTQAEVVRHDRELSGDLLNGELTLKIIDELLSSKEVEGNPKLKNTLEAIKNSLLKGDVEEASKLLTKLGEELNEFNGLSEAEKSLLAYLASIEVSEGEGKVIITLDPEKIKKFESLMSTEGVEVSDLEAFSSLLKLANVIQASNPKLAEEIRTVAYLMQNGLYDEAEQIYLEIKPSLIDEILKAYSNDFLTAKELAEILKYLPSEITSSGPVKYESDVMTSVLSKLLDVNVPTEVSHTALNPLQSFNQLNSLLYPFLELNAPSLTNLNLPLIAVTSMILIAVLALLTRGGGLYLAIHRKILSKKAAKGIGKPLKFIHRGELNEAVIQYYYLMLDLLAGIGVKKRLSETHREFMNKVSEETLKGSVEKICLLYEKAKFSGSRVSLNELEECKSNFNKLLEEVSNVKL